MAFEKQMMDTLKTHGVNIAILATSFLAGYLIYSLNTPKVATSKPKRPKARQLSQSLLDTLNEIPDVSPAADEQVWVSEESEALLNLIMGIAEQEVMADTVLHRSVTCNNCGTSPIRGFRFKCSNCLDFDLCANCEGLETHTKTHCFIKIRIPIPPQANPRTLMFDPFYPGRDFTKTSSFDTFKLEEETHCRIKALILVDSMEIMGFYDQFWSLSTVDHEDGGSA